MALHLWSSARYTIPLPEGHRFPIAKYALLRRALVEEGVVRAQQVHDPARARVEELLLVHTPEYVAGVTAGTLAPAELRRLGFPWSEGLVERSYRAVGGTC